MTSTKSLAIVLGLAWMVWVIPASSQNQASESAGDPAVQSPAHTNNPADMDLEELANTEIISAAGLTKMSSRMAPVTMTELDFRDVEELGASDLDHLLELYVPNAQVIDHHHLESHLGFRGIISDREDKYLYQVNGRTMNNRMWLGADNERTMPLLGDIRNITVVEGPVSATHGAGAVAGVINVETYNGLNFQGLDFTLRQDALDQYTAGEMRFGKKLRDGSGLFAYFGAADQPGIDSAYYIGHSYPATNGLPANVAGQPLSGALTNYGAAGFGEPRAKAHVTYDKGPLEIWARFTQDGGEDPPLREIYTTPKPATMSVADWVRGRQFMNRQSSVTSTFNQAITSHWSVKLLQSYARWDAEDQRMGTQTNAPWIRDAVEDESFSRAVATWSPSSGQSLAVGTEYSHEWFHDPYYSDALDRPPIVSQRDWQTNTVSFLGEYQGRIDRHWTLFLSSRGDKHTYSDWLLSPRGTLVLTLGDRDTVEFMAGKSVRRSGDEELWAQHVRLGTIPRPEALLSYEASYEHKLTPHWQLGTNTFYENYNAIGWIPALYYSSSIGRYKMAGGELQASYATAHRRIRVSHGITRLVGASIPASLPPGGQAITAEPYGYGNNLAEWAPYITKAALIQDIRKRWTASSSLVYYSGFPGAKDFAAYAATLSPLASAMPSSDPGYTTPYGPNLYVNAGAEFRPAEHWAVRLDGYNLAELADETLSKRNYYFRLSEFSVQKASVALSLRYHWGSR